MEQFAIQCRGIKKNYGEKETLIQALRGIDLEIEQGKLTLLVGPSGSGKTTLLSIITTILTPDEGQLLLMGQDISKMEENEKAEFCWHTLGSCFNPFFLYLRGPLQKMFHYRCSLLGWIRMSPKRRAIELLKKLNLAERSNISPENLSKGQQQKVAIARAMVNDSKIIICDEPTSALDHASGNEIMSLLKDLTISSDRAVLVVTHDHRIFSFADRIIYMSDGQIIPGEENA